MGLLDMLGIGGGGGNLRDRLSGAMGPGARGGTPQSFEELMALTHGDRDAAARRWNIQRSGRNSTAYSPSMEAAATGGAGAAPTADPVTTSTIPTPRPATGGGAADAAVPIPMPRPGPPLLEDRATRERPPGSWDLPVSPRRPLDTMTGAPTNNPPPPLEIAPSPFRGRDPLAASAPTNNPPPPLEIAPSPFRGRDPLAASAPTEIGAYEASKLKKPEKKSPILSKKRRGVRSTQYRLY
jgi:hypothetical protein